MPSSQFQLITGETTIGKWLRKMLPISYVLQGILLICLFWPSARFLVPIIGALILLVFICVAIIEASRVKRYHIGGIIRLSENVIALDNQIISVTDLQQVKVKFAIPRGLGVGRNGIGNSGNQIIICPMGGDEIVTNVFIEDRTQRDNLAKLLQYWRTVGISIAADGIDLA